VPGLVSGIYAFLCCAIFTQDVDGRVKPGMTKRGFGQPHPHFSLAMIARPITQSLSLSDRKLSASVMWVTRWR